MEVRRVRVGCEFRLEAGAPVACVFLVRPLRQEAVRVVREVWQTDPDVPTADFHDLYGNDCRRVTVPEGKLFLRYDTEVTTPVAVDDTDESAVEVPPHDLPGDVLIYTMPSRYCLSDVLAQPAWDLFGSVPPGWGRVQAISDWVHDNITFRHGSSTPLTTAADVFESREGVCRDFTQLAVTFCRALNIPARYVFGYLPDIDVGPVDEPMDFCAWMEVYLSGRWWTFDPRNNARRTGRVLIARGRDALDVAMVTSFGSLLLEEMSVWADEVSQVPTTADDR